MGPNVETVSEILLHQLAGDLVQEVLYLPSENLSLPQLFMAELVHCMNLQWAVFSRLVLKSEKAEQVNSSCRRDSHI